MVPYDPGPGLRSMKRSGYKIPRIILEVIGRFLVAEYSISDLNPRKSFIASL
ncbi:Uncharacterised protein [uncultured archaeon]|nr:Uncharacterised protein [uncultured archaeon]